MKKIYLDYAAATPVDKRVLAAMQPFWSDDFYNPSALYLDAKKVSREIENARTKIASVLGTRPGEIIFTAGGTEANNLAIHGIMQAYADGNILVSSIEHESVLQPAAIYKFKELAVDGQGVVQLSNLEKLIDDDTVLVSVMYANNEIGTIQPLAKIAEVIAAIRKSRRKSGNNKPLLLHTDACQAVNYLDIHPSRLGVYLMTLNSGKIYGPKQTGALYVKAGILLKPQISGGGQEHGFRSGTENVGGIVGFASALELAQHKRNGEVNRLSLLQKLFIDLLEASVPLGNINGSIKNRLPNNIHLTIPGQDNERLIMALDEAGVMAAAGSACSASNDEPSHVLKAIGLTDEAAQSSLRFTMGRQTTENEIRYVIETLAKLVV